MFRKQNPVPEAAPGPSRGSGATRGAVALPAVARVDLLPPIVEIRRKQSAKIRLLVLGLIGLVLVSLAAAVAVSLLADEAERALAREDARGQQLRAEQEQYSEVITVKSQLADYDNAEVVALYAEADWSHLLSELDDALPAGIELETEDVTIQAVSARQARDGLEMPGVVEITFTATAATFGSPTPLLNGLQTLTGYTGASVSAVAADSSDDGYRITGVVQLSTEAIGGTSRVNALDEELLAEIYAALEKPYEEPEADAATADDATAADETEE